MGLHNEALLTVLYSQMEMDVAFFRAFLSGKGIEITPEGTLTLAGRRRTVTPLMR